MNRCGSLVGLGGTWQLWGLHYAALFRLDGRALQVGADASRLNLKVVIFGRRTVNLWSQIKKRLVIFVRK